MQGQGFNVSAFHGGMDKQERDSALQYYRSGILRFLITTFERGHLGIEWLPPVSLSILYDLPRVRAHYIDCIGRCGAFGRKGVAIAFSVCEDERFMRDLERHYNMCVEEMPFHIADIL